MLLYEVKMVLQFLMFLFLICRKRVKVFPAEQNVGRRNNTIRYSDVTLIYLRFLYKPNISIFNWLPPCMPESTVPLWPLLQWTCALAKNQRNQNIVYRLYTTKHAVNWTGTFDSETVCYEFQNFWLHQQPIEFLLIILLMDISWHIFIFIFKLLKKLWRPTWKPKFNVET